MRRDAIEALAIEPSVAFIQRDLPLELGEIDGVNAIFGAQMDQFVYASMSPPGSHGPTSTGFTGSHVPTCRKGALLDAEPPRSDRA